jgi:GNAT superfamily N-acetyltransferase
MPAHAARIRGRTPGDLPDLIDALRAAHETRGYPSVWPDDPAAFVTGRGAAWVAEQGHRVVGQIQLTPLPDPLPAWAADAGLQAPLLEIKRLFVAPDAQGQGLARTLLRHAAAQSPAGTGVALQVNETSTPAVCLYESEGWRLAGRTRAAWTDPNGIHPWVLVYVAPGR